CESYSLPAISIGNQYFTGPGATGNELFEGSVITETQTVFIYAAAAGSCTPDERSFTVTINNTPVADAPGNVEACDSYTLPALTNGAYFAQAGGIDPINAQSPITESQTVYVYTAGNGSCEAAENSFTVTINNTPLADAPGDVEACDSYTLQAGTTASSATQLGGV